MSLPENAWEAVCVIATEQRWCWNLACTTCGAGLWRYALAEIGAGRHPADPNWSTSNDHRNLPSLNELRKTGSSRHMIDVLAEADLESIARRGPHPDWLGYQGVALRNISRSDAMSRKLTIAWGRQILALLPAISQERGYLEKLISDKPLRDLIGSREFLRWQDLGRFVDDLSGITAGEMGGLAHTNNNGVR